MNDLDLQNVGNPKWDRLKPEQRAQVADRVMRRTQKATPPTPVREPARPAEVVPELIAPAIITPDAGIETAPPVPEDVPVVSPVASAKLAKLNPEQRMKVADRVAQRIQKAFPATRIRVPAAPAELAPADVAPLLIAPPADIDEMPITPADQKRLAKLGPNQQARVMDRVMKRAQKIKPVREPAAPVEMPVEYVAPLLMTPPASPEEIPIIPETERKKFTRMNNKQRAQVMDRISRRSEAAPSNRPPEEPLEANIIMPEPVTVDVPQEYVTSLLMEQVADEQELADVPVEVRNKLARLQPESRERVKDRVRQRVRGESAKKLERIRQEEDAKANEIMKLAPTTEIFDRQEYPGGWPAPARTIPTRSRFTPQAPNKLVDIPVDLQQTIKNEIVEEHGIPPDEADVIASNAIDRWTEISRETPTPTSDEEAKMIAEAYQPAFMIEKLPGNLGELPDAMQAIVDDAKSLGWKSLVPLALGAGVLVLLLRKH